MATQNRAEVHDTPFRQLFGSARGVRWIAHAFPSHTSARVNA
jgi:hypothetical protein